MNKATNIKLAESWLKTLESDNHYKKLVDESIRSAEIIGLHDPSTGALKINGLMHRDLTLSPKKLYEYVTENFTDPTSTEGVCIINAGNYFVPGGRFLKGGFGEEESLCSVTGLYKILENSPAYKEHVGYSDEMSENASSVIYARNVPVKSNAGCYPAIDILTSFPPNANKVRVNEFFYYKETLFNRVLSSYIIPNTRGAHTLVIGTWGCTSQANDFRVVSEAIVDAHGRYGHLYKEVIVACGNMENVMIMSENEKVFK